MPHVYKKQFQSSTSSSFTSVLLLPPLCLKKLDFAIKNCFSYVSPFMHCLVNIPEQIGFIKLIFIQEIYPFCTFHKLSIELQVRIQY